MLAAAGAATVATALAVWVVPAFSGGTSGQWTWVSGPVLHDDGLGTAILTAHNASGEQQTVSVRAINPNGTTVDPSGSGGLTIPPGQNTQFSYDCSSGFGCSRVYELTTSSDDVVVGLAYDLIESTGVAWNGNVPPGGFTVFGPNQESVPSNVQAIAGGTAAIQTDTAKLQTENAALKADVAKLRKDAKKMRKQLKKVLKAVR
jgi:hypothetical protein